MNGANLFTAIHPVVKIKVVKHSFTDFEPQVYMPLYSTFRFDTALVFTSWNFQTNIIVSVCTTLHVGSMWKPSSKELAFTVVIITECWPYDIIPREPNMDTLQSEHCWQIQGEEKRKLFKFFPMTSAVVSWEWVVSNMSLLSVSV